MSRGKKQALNNYSAMLYLPSDYNHIKKFTSLKKIRNKFADALTAIISILLYFQIFF